ncbi:hypothetical protein B0H12DRAFT_1150290 [Mycena haematopus]|nr:hypothetical protein B0H12DRAFT_1150290 [Mycena haematopus]
MRSSLTLTLGVLTAVAPYLVLQRIQRTSDLCPSNNTVPPHTGSSTAKRRLSFAVMDQTSQYSSQRRVLGPSDVIYAGIEENSELSPSFKT